MTAKTAKTTKTTKTTSPTNTHVQPDRAMLAHLISTLDLTTLNATDTHDDVRALCARAAGPMPEHAINPVAAVCVYPVFAPTAIAALKDTQVRVASVATAFPHGQLPLSLRLHEIAWATEHGAHEIDVVVNRGLIREGKLDEMAREVCEMATLCATATPQVTIKVILETAEIESITILRHVSEIVLTTLHDAKTLGPFLKTSTGKGSHGATIDTARVMLQAVAEHEKATGHVVGFKVAGGVRSVADALAYYQLATDTLDSSLQLDAHRFRIGASSLLDELCMRF